VLLLKCMPRICRGNTANTVARKFKSSPVSERERGAVLRALEWEYALRYENCLMTAKLYLPSPLFAAQASHRVLALAARA
jgi:hypothetical protein